MDWYELVSGAELLQCDVLLNVPVPVIAASPEEAETEDALDSYIEDRDVLVLSQSCDLAEGKVDSVLVGGLQEWMGIPAVRGWGAKERRKQQAKVRRRETAHLALLVEHSSDPHLPWSVVDFRSLFTLPYTYLAERADAMGTRLRLVPPYREEIAQAFARYFMRVARPHEPSNFDEWNPPASPELAKD